MQKLRITQSLMSAFEWSFKSDDGYADFLRTLNREKSPPTIAMLNGIKYENILNAVLDGEIIPEDHEWYHPITEMAAELDGAQKQVNLFRDLRVDGVNFLIHGVLDYLKFGHIYDCKFVKKYHLRNDITKYMDSPQTSFYLYLVPEAKDMIYIISDGNFVYRERYERYQTDPPEIYVRNFMRFLEKHNLVNVYIEKWGVNN